MKDKAELISKEVADSDKDELIEALREKKKEKIINEIKQELKNEIDMEIADELNQKKLDDLKELMWSGFFLAFIVGLAVNQVTEIIDYCKGCVSLDDLWLTVIIAIILFLICLVAYLYSFVTHALSVINDNKKKEGKK